MTTGQEMVVVDGQDISCNTMPLLRATSIAQQMEQRSLAETSSPKPCFGARRTETRHQAMEVDAHREVTGDVDMVALSNRG